MLFNIPYKAKKQEQYMLEALRSPALQGDGAYCAKATFKLQSILSVERLLLTPSASHALELCFFTLDKEDEVIIPAYNFPSAANAVLRGGGRPVLCDIDPNTCNIDPQSAADRITPHTRAICVTHYAGIACDMEPLIKLCRENGLLLVEDAAQAIGSHYMDKPLGSVGDLACLSFHSTKNISCGEGGAYIHNTNELDFNLTRMRRDKGTDGYSFDPSRNEFYHWQTIGTSHLMPETSAALLLAQLEDMYEINCTRLRICARYDERLNRLFQTERLTAMTMPPYAKGNGHIYYFHCRNDEDKRRIRAYMEERGFPCLPHFEPLHLGEAGRSLGYIPGDFPVSESSARTLLRLPVYPYLNERDVDAICDALFEAVKL